MPQRKNLTSQFSFFFLAAGLLLSVSLLYVADDSQAQEASFEKETAEYSLSADDLSGAISGRVFQDFNGNGLFENSGGTAAAPVAIDAGLSGVTVSAYDSAGVLRGTAVTAANGTYTLNATGTGPYRIEFTGLPAGFFPSARSAASVNGNTVATTGSTVHFVEDGNTSNVNLALNRPGDFCSNNPEICSQLYGFGGATQPDALFTIPYNGGSTRTTGGNPVTDFTSPGNTSLATTDDVGTTFGLAYHRATRRIFAASYMKKHAKFGPGGPGAIYQFDRNTNAVSEFVNLNTVFGPGTAGTDPHNPLDYNTDNGQTTWNAVGKISFGGIALNADETFLYAMNLNDRRLYRIPTSGPLNSTTITSYPFPATMPNCTVASEVRPFAVTWYEGTLYVGAVCSRETSGGAISTNLRAYVYRFDPVTNTFAATPSVNIQLNYPRAETDPGYGAAWRNWRATYTTISTSHFIYPQPMVTDIDFDRGNMVLSLRDRNGDQSGYNSASNPNNPSQLFKGITAGDMLRLCGNPTSGWTLEANGRCGGIGNAPQNTNEGPGNGEYYYQDNYHPNGNPHDEVALGGASQIPGHSVLVATIFDPVYIPNDNIYDAGGFRWFVNNTGAQNRGYLAYSFSDFGKANGIGNVVPLCEAAPIEVGNRIWFDANSNGVQDPGEGPIAGVTVSLYQGSTLVGTAVTDANGEYYFVAGTTVDPNPTDHIGIVNGGLAFGTSYQIRLDNLSNFLIGGPLFGRWITTADQTSQAGDDEASDSDASAATNMPGSPLGTFPVVSFTTGGPGENDHRFDIGFATLAPSSSNVSVEGRVMTANGFGIPNASVVIFDAEGNTWSVLTGSFGYFNIEGIPAGETVFVSVRARGHVFKQPVQTITTNEKLNIVEFIASE